MSAHLVSRTHIDALLTAGLVLPRHGPLTWAWPEIRPGEPADAGLHEGRHRQLTMATAERVGTMLWDQNQRSVSYRYADEHFTPDYEFRPLAGNPATLLALVAVLKALDCYEYQSCEDPGWRRSEAWAFCDVLRAHAIERLPAYSDVPAWDITDPTIFTKLATSADGSQPARKDGDPIRGGGR